MGRAVERPGKHNGETERDFSTVNWSLLKNSLLVGGLAALLAVSFGVVAALWLAGLEKRWRNLFLAAAVIALALPPFLVTNCWLHFLGYAGVWRSWLPLNIFSLGGTVWILGLMTWPIALLAVGSAWRQLQPSQLESDPAVAGWALIRGLLWPAGRTALAQAAVVTFVLALNNFAVPAILQVKVFPAEMWVRFNTTFDTIGALRLSWPLVAVPLLLLLWLARREIPWPRLEGAVAPGLFRRQLGPGWFWFCGGCTITLCLLAVGLPLVQLISVKRTWTELPGALAANQLPLWNSVWLAGTSATLCIALGFMTWRWRVGPALWLAFLVPGVLLGIGLILLFNRPGLDLIYQSAAIVVLAFVIRYLALGRHTVAHALRSTDRDLTDAAHLEGATRWQMLRHVHWPQIAPQVRAAWYIVFLLCLWDVESMILVCPPGGQTLALNVFNFLHYGHNAQVNALCLTLLGAAVAPLVGWQAYSVLRIAHSRLRVGALRNTQYAIGSAAGFLVVLTGCSPGPAANDASIQSQLFNRVQIIGTRGVGVGQVNKPRSVAVDAQDNLYVVDMTGRVQKFSSLGVFVLSWQMPQTDLGKPKGMCRDREGNIVVVEPHYQRINHFTPEGKLVAQWGEKGTNAGQFTLPRAVAANSRDEVFVSEYQGAERVQKFARRKEGRGAMGEGSLAPEFLLSFGHAGTGPGEFNRPEGLCVDAQNRVYVADSCNHRIQIFSSDGQFIRAYGKAGSGKGELSYPYDICVDAAGRQYVCEFGNSRIQVFDASDRSIEIIGGPGAEPGRFSNPWGVALDSAGNLYVADSQNHRVQKFVR
jgi:ABC-type Fe3+ transport system permease subunit/DNA-binding beta-propeller fold protein YncE